MRVENKHNTYNTLFHWHSFKLKLVFEGIGVGIITGLLIVLYRFSLEKAGVLLSEEFFIVSVVAYIVADILASKPIYESLLEKFLHNQGEKLPFGNKKNKAILEFAVCMGSDLDGKQIKEIKWPSHCLLVAVK